MSILDDIVLHKREEILKRQELVPVKLLEQSIYFNTPCVSLKQYIKRSDKLGIIAEIKRQSPSKGPINPYISIERTSIGYMQAGASAISVLTDQHFFGGKNEDLTTARKFNYCPILRKDFMLNEYQIIEARSIGADAILLIAGILEPDNLQHLAKFAKSLGLEVLMEINNKEELDTHMNDFVDVLGVNNRNLKTFEVNVQTSLDLLEFMPSDVVRISESGISDPATVVWLREAGFDGFLIGEHFMKHSRPEQACARFIEEIRALEGQKKHEACK